MKKFRDVPKDEIRVIIQEHMENGWTLLKEDIWKKITDYYNLKRRRRDS